MKRAQGFRIRYDNGPHQCGLFRDIYPTREAADRRARELRAELTAPHVKGWEQFQPQVIPHEYTPRRRA